jgi:3-hydroxy-9,10-secoandrosta-1,3,5(10)-triene-9,17-dione monooxygenase reductase component
MSVPLSVTPDSLREVSGLFPTGIAVITARAAGGELYGVTINSFSSVSLDPPLVLFSLARGLHTLAALLSAGVFAIHFLREDQHQLSARFDKALSSKWDDVQYRAGVTGCPVLEPALALMECTLYAQYDGGDHVIIVGRVAHLEKEAGENPLVFFRGRYHTMGAEAVLAEETEVTRT